MATDDGIRGKLVQYEEPTWEPLLNLLGAERVGEFMWMHEVALDTGERVHAYKHIDTRRYIHLSDAGKTYTCVDRERYGPMPAFEAAELTLPPADLRKPLTSSAVATSADLDTDPPS